MENRIGFLLFLAAVFACGYAANFFVLDMAGLEICNRR